MAVERKTLFPEHLENAPVFIIDTEPKSRYFKITELPDSFTGGKNSFSIQGCPELVEDTLIHIEVKDAQGIRMYHEPAEGGPEEYYEGVSKPVAVYVYDDTAFGPCTITILGELKQYEIDGVKYDIPDEWKGRPNVRWQARLNVYPFLANTTRIRFYRRPKVSIEERSLPLYSRSVTNTTINGYCKGKAIIPQNEEIWNQKATYLLTSINPANAVFDQGVTISLPSSPAIRFNNKLLNQTITINNISSSKGFAIPGEETSLTSTIENFINGFNVYINPPHTRIRNTITSPTSEEAGEIDDSKVLVKDFAYATFTASYQTTTFQQSTTSASYAYVKIKDLETFSGDVYRLKVYAKSKNDIRGYSILEDLSLEALELLQERVFESQPNFNSGYFIDDTVLPRLWEGTIIDNTIATTQVAYEENVTNPSSSLYYPNSVVIEPDYYNNPNSYFYKFNNKNVMDFINQTDYILRLKLFSEEITTPAPFSITNASIKPTIIDVYMSGSAFVSGTQDFQFDIPSYGKKIGEFSTDLAVKRWDEQQIIFSPVRTGTGVVSFLVRNGKWKIADISIQPLRETAFSPNEFNFYTYPSIQIASESFDFRFEFFDINYNYVPIKLEKSIQFTGTNILTPTLDIYTYYLNRTPSRTAFIVTAGNPDVPHIDIDYVTTGTTSPVTIISGSQGGLQTLSTTGTPLVPNGPITINQWPGLLTLQTPGLNQGTYRLTWENFTGSFTFGPGQSFDVGSIDYKATLVNDTAVSNTFTIYRIDSVTTTTSTSTTTTTSTSTTSTTSTSTTTPPTPVGTAYLAIRNEWIGPGETIIDSGVGNPGCLTCDPNCNFIGVPNWIGINDIKIDGSSITNRFGGGSINYPITVDATGYITDGSPGFCDTYYISNSPENYDSGSIGVIESPFKRNISVTLDNNTTSQQNINLTLSGKDMVMNISKTITGGQSTSQTYSTTIPVGNTIFNFYVEQQSISNGKDFILTLTS